MSRVNKNDALKQMAERRVQELQQKRFDFKDGYKKMTGKEQDIEVELIKIEDLREAPKELNFYPPLSDTEIIELMDSIKQNKLLSPIVIWDNPNEESKYMILSGHNRVDSFKKLYDITKEEQYLKIPSIIKSGDDFTETMARSIIIEANHQRKKDRLTIAKEIMIKYCELESDSNFIGNRKKYLADKSNLSTAVIMKYAKLSKLINPIKDMVFKDDLTLNAALKLADLSDEKQEYLYKNFKDELNSNSNIKSINNETEIEDIKDILIKKKREVVKVSYKIPSHKKEEFDTMITKWMKENNIV